MSALRGDPERGPVIVQSVKERPRGNDSAPSWRRKRSAPALTASTSTGSPCTGVHRKPARGFRVYPGRPTARIRRNLRLECDDARARRGRGRRRARHRLDVRFDVRSATLRETLCGTRRRPDLRKSSDVGAMNARTRNDGRVGDGVVWRSPRSTSRSGICARGCSACRYATSSARRATRCRSTAAADSRRTTWQRCASSSAVGRPTGIARGQDEGRARPGADRTGLRAARDAIGATAELFVDANGAYAVAAGDRLAQNVPRVRRHVVRAAGRSRDLHGTRFVRERAPAGMEIASGEYVYRHGSFARMLAAEAVDVLQADATRCGGYSGFLAIDGYCEGTRTRSRRIAHRCSTCTSRPPPAAAARRVVSRPRADRADALRRLPRARRRSARPDRYAPGTRPDVQTPRGRAVRGITMIDLNTGLERCPCSRSSVRSRPARGPSQRVERRRRGLETALRPQLARRGALRRRDRARSTRPTPRTTAKSRSASSSRGPSTTSIATVEVARAVRRADPLARRRHVARRPVLQRRGRHRLLEVPEPRSSRSTPKERWARVEPGVVLDDLRDAAATARPHLRSRSRDAHAQHARRDDRQQLVRRCTRRWPARPTTTSSELDVLHLRRRADARRADERRRARRASSRAAAARRDLRAACATCATGTPTRSARASPTSRAASRATTSTSCCPRTASTSRARWSAPRAPASPCSRRRCSLDRQARRSARSSCSAIPTSTRAADHVPRVIEHKPIGARRDRRPAHRRHERQSTLAHRQDLALLPGKASGWLIVEFGGDDEAEAREAQRALARRDLLARRLRIGCRLIDDPDEQRSSGSVREAGLGATAFVPGEPRHLEGWEDSAVPPDALGAYLRDLRALCRPLRLRSALYGHFGQGCIHCRIDFDLATAAGHRHLARVPRRGGATSCVATAARSPASTATASRAASSAEDVRRRSSSRRFASSRRSGIPHGKMNPGKVVDPYADRPRTCARARLRAARADDPLQLYPDERRFAHAAIRCVGVGKCRRHDRRHDVPELHASRARRSTRPAAARTCSSRCCEGDAADGRLAKRSRQDALDLCLACKGCKDDCPVNVDMATYKAEFLVALLRGRLRPRPPTRSG